MTHNDIKYDMMIDEELISRFQASDLDAFDILASRYIYAATSRANSYSGNGIDTEDLFQEGMIGLLNAAINYQSSMGASFKTFAWLCIDRNIINAVRYALRKKNIPLASFINFEDIDKGLNFQSLSQSSYNPQKHVESKEDMQVLLCRINKLLSKKELNVLSAYITNKSYSVVASELNISKKSVDNTLRRLRSKLKQSDIL